eukprot:CCRYP_014792-RA/>CCRYP_014792-RA protein AED:0.05 eAED:0.05 QI:241/1/1/1/1/1/2/511/217
MEGESALITKLHAKLSLFRRDRDDALRHKELSVERLRIVRKDREAAAAEVRAMQSKLLELREGTKRKIGELAIVEREVEGLKMEYKFQHSELTSKKEKLHRLDAKRNNESNTRHLSATSSREALRKRREKSTLNASISKEFSFDEKKRQLESSIGQDVEEWMASLPELIRKRTVSILEDVDDTERDCVLLRRKIAGYQNVLGVGEACAESAGLQEDH